MNVGTREEQELRRREEENLILGLLAEEFMSQHQICLALPQLTKNIARLTVKRLTKQGRLSSIKPGKISYYGSLAASRKYNDDAVQKRNMKKVLDYISEFPNCTHKNISDDLCIPESTLKVYTRYLLTTGEIESTEIYRYADDSDRKWRVKLFRPFGYSLAGINSALTEDERTQQILNMITQVITAREIANELKLSQPRVEYYLHKLLEQNKISRKAYKVKCYYAPVNFDFDDYFAEKIRKEEEEKLRIELAEQKRKEELKKKEELERARRKLERSFESVYTPPPVKVIQTATVEKTPARKPQNDKEKVQEIIKKLKFHNGSARIELLTGGSLDKASIIDYLINERIIVKDKSVRPVQYKLVGY